MESAWGLESETALGPTLFSVWADVLRNLTGFSQVSQTLESALLTGDTLNVHQRFIYFSSHISFPSKQEATLVLAASEHIHVSAGQFLHLPQFLLFYFIWPGVTHSNAQIQSWPSYRHLTALSFTKQNFSFFPLQHRPT